MEEDADEGCVGELLVEFVRTPNSVEEEEEDDGKALVGGDAEGGIPDTKVDEEVEEEAAAARSD